MAGGPDYAGKPRPTVIIQDDRFDATRLDHRLLLHDESDRSPGYADRYRAEPGERLERPASKLMVDKVTTVPKSKLGKRLGRLTGEDMLRLNRAIVVFLGLSN